MLVALCISLSTPAAMADPPNRISRLTDQDAELLEDLATGDDGLREDRFLARMLNARRITPRRRRKRRKLDLTPLADMAIAYLKEQGVPIVETRDEKRRPIAIDAEFAVAGDVPSLKMHLGDRAAEPLGAFYPPERGFRFSVVYPMEQWSLRVEAGDDSEFGSRAVAGLTWVHPNQRYAVGFGLPMRIKHAEGDFGAIMQFRMNLP